LAKRQINHCGNSKAAFGGETHNKLLLGVDRCWGEFPRRLSGALFRCPTDLVKYSKNSPPF
jgi:hypothetical protein